MFSPLLFLERFSGADFRVSGARFVSPRLKLEDKTGGIRTNNSGIQYIEKLVLIIKLFLTRNHKSLNKQKRAEHSNSEIDIYVSCIQFQFLSVSK